MNSTVTTVTKIETPQYVAHASLANISTTWKRAQNATNAGTGFVCPVLNTRMTAIIIVGTTIKHLADAWNVVPP
jgi:hypothetical protein